MVLEVKTCEHKEPVQEIACNCHPGTVAIQEVNCHSSPTMVPLPQTGSTTCPVDCHSRPEIVSVQEADFNYLPGMRPIQDVGSSPCPEPEPVQQTGGTSGPQRVDCPLKPNVVIKPIQEVHSQPSPAMVPGQQMRDTSGPEKPTHRVNSPSGPAMVTVEEEKYISMVPGIRPVQEVGNIPYSDANPLRKTPVQEVIGAQSPGIHAIPLEGGATDFNKINMEPTRQTTWSGAPHPEDGSEWKDYHYPHWYRRGQYDASIVYSDGEDYEAYAFKDMLERCVILKNGKPPKLTMVGDLTGLAQGKLDEMRILLNNSTYMFFMVTDKLLTDSYMALCKDECLIASLEGEMPEGWKVVPITYNLVRIKLPFGLKGKTHIRLNPVPCELGEDVVDAMAKFNPDEKRPRDKYFLKRFTDLFNTHVDYRAAREIEDGVLLERWKIKQRERLLANHGRPFKPSPKQHVLWPDHDYSRLRPRRRSEDEEEERHYSQSGNRLRASTHPQQPVVHIRADNVIYGNQNTMHVASGTDSGISLASTPQTDYHRTANAQIKKDADGQTYYVRKDINDLICHAREEEYELVDDVGPRPQNEVNPAQYDAATPRPGVMVQESARCDATHAHPLAEPLKEQHYTATNCYQADRHDMKKCSKNKTVCARESYEMSYISHTDPPDSTPSIDRLKGPDRASSPSDHMESVDGDASVMVENPPVLPSAYANEDGNVSSLLISKDSLAAAHASLNVSTESLGADTSSLKISIESLDQKQPATSGNWLARLWRKH